MKKILLIFAFLLNLLPIVTNNHIIMGLQGARAQSMGSENITYYPCENDNGDMYFSMTPCPESQLPDVCITACKYCQNSMDCDLIKFHHCNLMPKDEEESNWKPKPDQPDNNLSTGGSGGISNNKGNSSSKNDGQSERDSRNYDFNGNAPWPSKTISKEQFYDDLDKTIADPSSIRQGDDGTCGAAVIEKLLAELFPIEFDKAATSLYAHGYYDPWQLQLKAFSATDKICADKGKSTVDMIFQTVITQENNWYYYYFDPAISNSNFKASTLWLSVSSFLRNNIGLKVYVQDSPTYKDIQKALNNKQILFIIALVCEKDGQFISNELTDADHYVQIQGATNDSLTYWSWGENGKISHNPIRTGVAKLFKIGLK